MEIDKMTKLDVLLGEATIQNFMQAIVTDTVRVNADFQYKAGLNPKIVRKASKGCCDWCKSLEGTYNYEDVYETGNDVWKRHTGCHCTVTYDPGTGKVQNVWDKSWRELGREEKIEERKAVGIEEVSAETLEMRQTVGLDEAVEMTRRWVAEDGHEIIDKPTFNKITKEFRRRGGEIRQDDEAEELLKMSGASASYMAGENLIFLRKDPTVSDVLEETFHAEQHRLHRFGDTLTEEVKIRREIEAQEHLLSVIDKYKIPPAETAVTKKNLADYRTKLKKMHKEESEFNG